MSVDTKTPMGYRKAWNGGKKPQRAFECAGTTGGTNYCRYPDCGCEASKNPWHCAGCGKPAKGNFKSCDCITFVGSRKGPNDKTKYTVFDEPGPSAMESAFQRHVSKLSDEHRRKYEAGWKYAQEESGALAGQGPEPRLPDGLGTKDPDFAAGYDDWQDQPDEPAPPNV